jgi:hypothetical protein
MNYDNETDNEYRLDLGPISQEDIDQEAELLKLLGVPNPSKALIYRRMSRTEAIYDEIPLGAVPLFSDDPLPDPWVTESLVEFAQSNSEQVANIIFDFLSDPSEDKLPEVFAKLSDQGVQLHYLRAPKAKSLAQALHELLVQGDQQLQDLYNFAQAFQPSNRPQAAVRQILRRFESEGKISRQGESIHLL